MNEMILRGRTLSFHRMPESETDMDACRYHEDGAVHVENGKIVASGQFNDISANAPDVIVRDHRPDLLLPGFIDTHIHLPQAQMVAAYAPSLMQWLADYTFVEEQKFANPAHAKQMACRFLDELLSHGTTTAAVYGSVHAQSVDALFAESENRNMLIIAGKVMMDRNGPTAILDTPQTAYDDSKRLINDWHGRGRLQYAVTPRFAITSTPEQLAVVQLLTQEHQDCFVQTHLAENDEEIELVSELFPDARDYTDVYAKFGILGPRSLLGHCLHLSDRELGALRDSESVAVFCPTSNLFLGSGLFDWQRTQQHAVQVATATDVAAGTSFSMLTTMDAAYKVLQLQGQRLNPLYSFYQITLGNAQALGLEEQIGTLDPGTDADIIVLDSRASSSLRLRMETVGDLADELMVLQTLADERVVKSVYVRGKNLKS